METNLGKFDVPQSRSSWDTVCEPFATWEFFSNIKKRTTGHNPATTTAITRINSKQFRRTLAHLLLPFVATKKSIDIEININS